jgi:hypothetical protein
MLLTVPSMAPGPWVKIHNRSELEMDAHVVQEEEDGDDAEGPRYKYYKSEKVLGRLFRAVDERMIWEKEIKVRGNERNFWGRLAVAFESWAMKAGYGMLDWPSRREEAEQIRLTCVSDYQFALWMKTDTS